MVKIKAYNSKELSNLYGVSYKVFLIWVKKIKDKLGDQVGRVWNIKQVKIMFNHFGNPEDE